LQICYFILAQMVSEDSSSKLHIACNCENVSGDNENYYYYFNLFYFYGITYLLSTVLSMLTLSK
jgi:hypothetical protein